MQNIMVSRADKVAALQGNAYFSTLSAEVLEDLARGVSLHLYQRGETICWQGDACSGLFIIRSGSVKLFKLSSRGRELIIRTIAEGATFNEVPVFDHGLNPINVAALEDSYIWVVKAEVIRACMEKHPEMSQAVILNLSKNLRTLVSIVEELSFYQVTNRLARLIARLSPEELEDKHLTQDQLAAHLGTVREVVARSLRDLERSGAIRVQRRKIQILDERTLRDWTDEPCN